MAVQNLKRAAQPLVILMKKIQKKMKKKTKKKKTKKKKKKKKKRKKKRLKVPRRRAKLIPNWQQQFAAFAATNIGRFCPMEGALLMKIKMKAKMKLFLLMLVVLTFIMNRLTR